MCGDANARHYGRLAVSAEPLKMVSQRVPNHAKSEWNATLLQHRPHDADRMTHSVSLKIRMHPVRSEFASQEINLANREEMAQQVPSELLRRAHQSRLREPSALHRPSYNRLKAPVAHRPFGRRRRVRHDRLLTSHFPAHAAEAVA